MSLFSFNPSSSAQSSSSSTKLYFHGTVEEMGMAYMYQKPPEAQNDTMWPPRLTDTDDVILWLSSAFFSNFFEDIDENFSGFEDFLNISPFAVTGLYEYAGEEPLYVNGDIVFDLYFYSPITSKLLNKDDVKISISYLTIDLSSDFGFSYVEVKNFTTTINPRILGDKITGMQIILEDVDFELPEFSMGLQFTVEIRPSDKLITRLIDQFVSEDRLIERWESRVERWQDSPLDILQNISAIADEFLTLWEEFNLSKEDFTEVINAFSSSSFVYNSAQHPSSVSLPIQLPGEPTDNDVIYYLHEESMDIELPTNEKNNKQPLSEDKLQWAAPSLSRSKLLDEVTATLYLNANTLLNIRDITVACELLDKDTVIATSPHQLKFDTILSPPEPIMFTFSDLNDYELEYDHSLTLAVYLANDSKMGLQNLGRKVKLHYDTVDTPSALYVSFEDTENIQIDSIASDPADEEIIPGDTVTYTLEISSEKADTIHIDAESLESEGSWSVAVEPETVTLPAGGTANITISVTSEATSTEAYDVDYTDLLFTIAGKTGRITHTTTVDVTSDAIHYDVQIVTYTDHRDIKKGENNSFFFIILNNNTGVKGETDSYTIIATSQNDWRLEYNEEYEDLAIGETSPDEEIIVKAFVPEETNETQDTITVKIISQNNPDTMAIVNVTVNVEPPSILESIYQFFESLGEELGLDETFGDNAPIALAAICMIIIFFIIILIALIATQRHVELICLNRAQEITPDQHATYTITLKNPRKKKPQHYKLSVETKNHNTDHWTTDLTTTTITIPPSETKDITFTVTPTEHVEKDEWIEAILLVETPGKRRIETISTMTTICEGETHLSLTDVFTWPRTFSKGDRIITSFKVHNKGNLTARNVTIFLYINGKQKNKVEDITIPPGAYAEIRMPWIAVKGKNELELKIAE